MCVIICEIKFLMFGKIYYWKVDDVLVMFISCDIVKSFGS